MTDRKIIIQKISEYIEMIKFVIFETKATRVKNGGYEFCKNNPRYQTVKEKAEAEKYYCWSCPFDDACKICQAIR